jgi:hypothetical protein
MWEHDNGSATGTVLATADSAGNVLSSADYRPYGSQTGPAKLTG